MTVRSYHHSEFPADRLRDERIESISVCVPAREEALTIAGVVQPLVALREAGVVDQVLVVDGDSADFDERFACGLLGPLVCEPRVQYVKGYFRRPFRVESTVASAGGGRVT